MQAVLTTVNQLVDDHSSWWQWCAGVASGYVPYGAYSYTDLSSPCISYVPVDVPFSWYMMLYPCFSTCSPAQHAFDATAGVTQ
jgi:hypothetical protein